MIHEPMTDLVILLGKLVDAAGKILVPGVEEMVEPPTDEERYVRIVSSSYFFTECEMAGQFMKDWIIQLRMSINPQGLLLPYPPARQRR